MSEYLSVSVINIFKELIYELKSMRINIYEKINNLYQNSHVSDNIKDNFGIKIAESCICMTIMIAKFEYVFNEKENEFMYGRKTHQHTMFTEYNLSVLYDYVNKIRNVVRNYKNDMSMMDINIDNIVHLYPNNYIDQGSEDLLIKLQNFFKYENIKLTKNLSKMLDDFPDRGSDDLKDLMNEYKLKMLVGEKIMLRLRKYIFSIIDKATLMDEFSDISKAIDDYIY